MPPTPRQKQFLRALGHKESASTLIEKLLQGESNSQVAASDDKQYKS